MVSVPHCMNDCDNGCLAEHRIEAYLPRYPSGPFHDSFKWDHKTVENKREARGGQEPQLGLLVTDSQALRLKFMPESTNRSLKNTHLGHDLGNTFWIAVSDYQPNRAHLVYRFFQDIGNIAAKSFTKSNMMYLRYFSNLDSQIALSYDGQKIGYDGDIRVNVKLKKPVEKNAVIGALKRGLEVNNIEKCPCDIEIMDAEKPTTLPTERIEANRMQGSIGDEEGQYGEVKPQTFPIKMRLLEWLRMKLSYVFYFY